MKRFLFVSAIVLMDMLAFVGCANDDNGNDSVPATAVVLDVTEKDLVMGRPSN